MGVLWIKCLYEGMRKNRCVIQIVGIICIMSQLGHRPKTRSLNPVGIMQGGFGYNFQQLTTAN